MRGRAPDTGLPRPPFEGCGNLAVPDTDDSIDGSKHMRMRARMMLAAASFSAFGAGTAAAGMAEGEYECWYFNQPRLGLNFAVTGPTTYTHTMDGKPGEYELNGKTLTWKSGPMQGSMPDGFTTIYEVRGGTPTVAFMSGRGAEAAFCEKAS